MTTPGRGRRRPATTSDPDPAAADLELLRRFEPIVHYTAGEQFLPAPVDGYLAACDLLVGRSERERRILAPVGALSAESLGGHTAPPGESLYLRLVQEPFDGVQMTRWQLRPDRVRFRSHGRLARVGLFARLVDAGFTISLLLRGTVPGGTAAAAQEKYQRAHEIDPRVAYHARVVRQDGWVILHYLFFYFMNDYRSTFGGANDHEADWEQVLIYLDDGPDGPVPVWIAAAAHDYTGDDLRRRWDDPALTLDGDHPVLYAGGGSHASYFEQGEYLTDLPLPFARSVRGVLDSIRTFWRDTLNQPDPGDLAQRLSGALSVPFIDHALGDGTVVGTGGTHAWTPIPIDDDVPWVMGYRGLFGLDTFDRFAGERAPAGPRYTRAGSVRQTWNDPLGFAGLGKVAPPSRQPAQLRTHITELEGDVEDLDRSIAERSAAVPGLELEVRALATDGSLAAIHAERLSRLASEEHALAADRAKRAATSDAIGAARTELGRLEAGDPGDPRAHLRHDMRPEPPTDARYGLLVELWSAISVGLLLLLVVSLTWLEVLSLGAALLVAAATYVVIEAAFRHWLTVLLLRVSLLLAVIAAIILVWTFRDQVVLLGIVGVALFVLVDNIRELVRR